jgi:amidase
MSARELASAIRSGRASSREVVEAHLRRIDEVNPRLNALAAVLAESAVAAAEAADRAVASGAPLGALHGVPVSVKENVDVAGLPTTHGVRSLAGAVAELDSPQVANLRADGAIVLGRGNLPEFALRWDTVNDLHGQTRNPWDPTLTPGGSSGGDAVAVAAGMVPLGLGNDDGGSLRYPPQCAGVAAIKPSLGRVPRTTGDPSMESPISHQLLNAEGVMGRDVEDVRLALSVMSRPSWRDPWQVPVPLDGDEGGRPRVALAWLERCSPQVAAGVAEAARLLEEAGHVVVEADPPSIEEAADAWTKMFAFDSFLTWDRVAPLLSEEGRRQMEITFELAGPVSAGDYQRSYVRRLQIARQWAEFHQEHPLVLGPVSTRPPFALGSDLTTEGLRSILDSMRLVVTVNLLGLPAAVVPVGVVDGLPQVAQLIGRRFREDQCLDAAAAIQARSAPLTPVAARVA